LKYLGARVADKMNITHHLADQMRQAQGDKAVADRVEGRKKDYQNATIADEGATPPPPGGLTADEQHEANRIKSNMDPKAGTSKDAPENWQTLDVKFADGTTQTVQRNTKDGRFTDLTGAPIPPEKLSTAKAVPKPTAVHAPTPKAGVSGGKNVFAVLTDNGWVDAGSKEPLKDFRPAPSFAETGLWGVDPVQHADGSIGSAMVNRRTGQVKNITSLDGSPIAPALLSQVNKSIEPALEAETRLNVMEQNAKDSLAGNQQAMLSLVANHIGMTLGAQKGARINQAVWNEAVGSAPWLENVEKKFGPDGYLQGVVLGPGQIKQMLELGRQRRDQQWKQAKQAGETYGVNVPTPIDNTPEGPKTKELKSTRGWKAPADAPPAPKQDGKVLKADGKVIAKSKGGQWVQP
jgi:hypothetical protein